jgi:type IV pilus assembly protein PilO
MEQLLARITALPVGARLAALVLLPVLVAGGYWYFVYGDMLDEMTALDSQIRQLKEERKGYEQRKKELLAYKNEVNQLLEEQKELLRVLPKNDDIEQFIEGVNAQVELAGLSKVSSVREKPVTEEMFVRHPIRMSLVGQYHQINKFFKNIGELQRIVNILDLQLAPVEQKGANAGGSLKADFIAQTFQLNDARRKAGGSTKVKTQATGAAPAHKEGE